MRNKVAGIITASRNNFVIKDGMVRWDSSNPNVIYFDLKKEYGPWGMKDQKIVLRVPAYSLYVEDYARETPNPSKLKNPDEEYRIVETDDGKWFATGSMDDLHVKLVSVCNIPVERIKKGLYSREGILVDFRDASEISRIRVSIWRGLSSVHLYSTIWAIEHGLEKNLFEKDWRSFYTSLKRVPKGNVYGYMWVEWGDEYLVSSDEILNGAYVEMNQ